MKNKNIYIIGSSGFAKEVAQLSLSLNYNIQGFIDLDKKSDTRIGDKYYPVLDEKLFLEKYLSNRNEINVAIGIGDPSIIKNLVKFYDGFLFPNLIHKSSQIDETHVKIGQGNIITAHTVFTTSIEIGNFNVINLSCTIGHDVVIKNYNVINPSASISGNVKIGNANLIGVSSTILQNIKIGNNNIIGASALITKDVDDNSLMVGVPAKNIK